MNNKKITVKTFLNNKKNSEKISMLTAYDYSTAKYFDEAHREEHSIEIQIPVIQSLFDNINSTFFNV